MHKLVLHIVIIIAIALAIVPQPAAGQQKGRERTQALAGESIDMLLTRCKIDMRHHNLFIAINWPRLTKDDMLMLGFNYYLPNETDIANSQAIIEKEKAARSERYNTQKAETDNSSKKEGPSNTPSKPSVKANATGQKSQKRAQPKYYTEPLFGKGNERVDYTDSKLAGATYYLVSGHGGPDPGAMGTYNGQQICEDEYAYDVILRLARQLISHRATVHIIIQDPNDGIREDAVLKCDEDETCMGAPIPLDQVERLKQRSDSINSLYAQERKGYCRSVFIHVDSRSKEKRIDIFFYHYMKSARGERLAKKLQSKMAQKYAKHQPARGFSGEVKERDLYVLRRTNPAGVFIEIGNIQNDMDMVRLTKPNNREAMARWMAEALIEDYTHK